MEKRWGWVYEKQDILDNIKALSDRKFEDINIPLRVLKNEEPELFKKTYNKLLKENAKQEQKEYHQKPEVKQRIKKYHQKPEVKQKSREYMRRKLNIPQERFRIK